MAGIRNNAEVCGIKVSDPCGLVVFGATGALSRKKLMPALFRLFKNNLLSDNFYVLGAGRTRLGTGDFRNEMMTSVRDAAPDDFNGETWEAFSQRLNYIAIDYLNDRDYRSVDKALNELDSYYSTQGRAIFYLAVPPSAFEPIIENIGASGMTRAQNGCRHIVVEKPFGLDLESARRLNSTLRRFFSERQIFRIDHFIAKETVQNILMFRFANSIFEPLWNNEHIDHVQITAAETIGIESRASYYEEAGVVRDMFPNHLFQLMSIVAMEPPPVFEPEAVRDEKVKVLRSIRPFELNGLEGLIVVGQYGKGIINNAPVARYREEQGVSGQSYTPTYAAMKVFLDNWRWKGVPFYLRSGKRLKRRATEISVHFKAIPHLMFSGVLEDGITPNVLVLRVEPHEGISLVIQTKMPGSKVCLSPFSMDFSYPRGIRLEAYEWVLLDCMAGDQMLFVREDGVEKAWAVLTPVIERLEKTIQDRGIDIYEAGSNGPSAAASLMERDGRVWRAL